MRSLRRQLRRCTATTAMVLLVAGCTSGGGGSSAGEASTSTAPASGLPAPASSAPAGSASPALAAALALTGTPGPPQDVVTGLDVPWNLTPLPDGTVLVTERDTARLVRVGADGSQRPVVGTGEGGAVAGVTPRGEGGLLGLVASPSFASDSTLYAFVTTATDDRVVRMVLEAPAAGQAAQQPGRLSDPVAVLTGIPSATVHHGGRLAFGPDGMLYVSTGEAGNPSASQDLDSLGGKVLRVTPDGQPAPGNPFPGSPVWTYGHRNVQGLGWDAQGRLFATEFGQDRLDELNLLQPGRNYGWPKVEGTLGSAADKAGTTAPLVTWSTDDASPSGLLVTGDALYVAALQGRRLWRIPESDGSLGTPQALLTDELGRLRDVAAGPDGALWVLTNNTARGTPRPGDDRVVRLPLS